MLIALACWGLHITENWTRYILALAIPVIAAILWGIFRIPNDPKPAPVVTRGVIRLLLEWFLFSLAVWGLYACGYIQLSIIMAVVVLLHYIVSYDRTWAMLRNKPYNGFVK
jgi:hypothetical protein